MGKVAGSIKGVSLDGIGFDVTGDSSPSVVGGKTENDAIPTSGQAILKKTNRIQKIESLDIGCGDEELETLRELSNREVPFPLSYTTAGRGTFISTGAIELESHSPEEAKATVTLLPVVPWELF
jgi:hypothetical protein